MNHKGTLDRLKKYGIKDIVKSWSFYLPLIVVSVSYFVDIWFLTPDDLETILSTGRSISLALAGMVLTGLVIMISIAGKRFLSVLQRNDAYDKLFFLFEYNTSIAVLTALISLVIEITGYSDILFHIFIFLLLHLILCFIRLISAIVTFGEKQTEFEAIDGIDGEMLRENSDIPDFLLQEEYQSGKEGDLSEDTNSETDSEKNK